MRTPSAAASNDAPCQRQHTVNGQQSGIESKAVQPPTSMGWYRYRTFSVSTYVCCLPVPTCQGMGQQQGSTNSECTGEWLGSLQLSPHVSAAAGGEDSQLPQHGSRQAAQGHTAAA